MFGVTPPVITRQVLNFGNGPFDGYQMGEHFVRKIARTQHVRCTPRGSRQLA